MESAEPTEIIYVIKNIFSVISVISVVKGVFLRISKVTMERA